MNDNVDRPRESCKMLEMKPDGFAHATPNPVPFHRAPKGFSHGKSYSHRARAVRPRACQEKDGKIARKVAPAVFIHATKIRVLQQMHRLGKFGFRSAAHG